METPARRRTNRSTGKPCVCEMLEPRVLLSAAVAAPPTFHPAPIAPYAERTLDGFDDDWNGSPGFWEDLGDDPDPSPPTQPAPEPWPEPSPEPDPWSDPAPPWSDPYYPPSDNGPIDDYSEPAPIEEPPYSPVFCRPATPTALKAVAVSATCVHLTWRGDTNNARGFRILRLGPGGASTIVACVSGRTTQFTDTNLLANTTYTYAVSAYNNAGTSGYSRPVNVTTPDGARPPVGFLDVANASIAKGWTVDPDMPTRSLVVSATLDGASLSTQNASGFRADLIRPYRSANHGFTFNLPTLTPGKHRVEIFATDTVTGLKTRIATRTIDRPATGFLDRIDRSTIAGWAFDADAADAPILIRYTIDRQPARIALAGVARNDLVAHVGSAKHGFTIKLPKLTAGPHTLTVYAVDPLTSKLALLGRRIVH